MQSLVALGTLGMPDYGHQKWWYLLQGNFDSYFYVKNKFMSYIFLAKILQLCYFRYFIHVWTPTPKQQYLPVRNFDIYLHFFLEILHFNEFSVWLVKSILTHSLRKNLLLHKEFAVKYMTIWCFILDYLEEKLKRK